MRVRFFGVRGSMPAAGPAFVRHGGNTSCVAISRGDEDPTIVLDAGTGLHHFSRWLDGRPFRGTILLGHLHWDHIQGLPFFPAAEHPNSRTRVLVPGHDDPVAALAQGIGHPYFPLTPTELRGRWSFDVMGPGEHQVEGFSVTALEIPHLGSTYGFRVSDGGATVAYLSDHSPSTCGPGPAGLGEYHEAAMALVAGADLLIHDAQHVATDFPAKAFLGHSAAEYAVGLAEAAGCGRVALYHHDFDRTDDEIDDIVAAFSGGSINVTAAAEGAHLDITETTVR